MSISNPLVSILLCTYNAGDTIENTVYACLQQIYTNLELLIHDDQSSDDTLSKIKNIADPRIKILYSGKRLGPYEGLNFLLQKAEGIYIAIQDHDDLWHPEKIKKQIAFLEVHHEFVGCGTKTLMWYEGDQIGFEYYLGKESFYAIHPSLVFRNEGYRYTNDVYMNDALFQKKVLCHGEKKIANLDETLTLHRIKDGATNFSYKRFVYSRATLKTIFTLHPVRYGICVIGWETMRKIVYPVLQGAKKGCFIDKIERIPFVLQGYVMQVYTKDILKSLKLFQ